MDGQLAVAYLRVSTGDQSLGPEAQEEAIRRWCARNEVRLVEPFCVDRGKSGGLHLEKRPGLVQAIDALKEHGAGLLVVHKRDRMARDREVMGLISALLRRMGCRLVATNQKLSDPEKIDPMAKAMQGIEDVFAELERSLIKARTKAALEVKRSRGERIGTIPYGYRLGSDGQSLEVDKAEQKTVKKVKKMRARGMSLRAVGRALEAEGICPRTGKSWYPTTIKNIAEASAYGQGD